LLHRFFDIRCFPEVCGTTPDPHCRRVGIFSATADIFLKNTIAFVVLATWLAACASNQPNSSVDSEADATTSDISAPTRKKVCKYERSSGGGSSLERVCRYVDTT